MSCHPPPPEFYEEVLRATDVFELLRLADPVRFCEIPGPNSPIGRRIYEQVVSTPRDAPLTRQQRRLLRRLGHRRLFGLKLPICRVSGPRPRRKRP